MLVDLISLDFLLQKLQNYVSLFLLEIWPTEIWDFAVLKFNFRSSKCLILLINRCQIEVMFRRLSPDISAICPCIFCGRLSMNYRLHSYFEDGCKPVKINSFMLQFLDHFWRFKDLLRYKIHNKVKARLEIHYIKFWVSACYL